jgi:arylsulfatase A
MNARPGLRSPKSGVAQLFNVLYRSFVSCCVARSVLRLRRFLVVLLLIPFSSALFAELSFKHHFIDTNLPGTSYGQTALVDIDKDGDLDFITGGTAEGRSIFWFEYGAPDKWTRHLLGQNHPSDVGGAAMDVDGDGWLDHVTGGVWYRNTGKPRSESFERIVFDPALTAVHDLVIADLDGDGRRDIVTMSDKNNLRWYRVGRDPGAAWERHDIGSGVHAGVAIGDIDGDGDLDIARSNTWFENTDGKALKWAEHDVPFGNAKPPYPFGTRCVITDIDRDGRMDLVMTENEIRQGKIAWLRNMDGKGREWKVTLLPHGDADARGAYHSLAVADFDRDGDEDIFTVEMEGIPGARQPRWFIWENVDGKGQRFVERVILDNGLGGHEAVVADVDGDGDLDIASKLWRPRKDNSNGGRNHADFLENVSVRAGTNAHSLPGSSRRAHGAGRPNIILILTDDMGYETVGANGGASYRTPSLDRLAATGARFQHCYVQPLCTPTRVQLMTGQYNVRNYTLFGQMPSNAVTFGNLFKQAGYATCIAGKWQLGRDRDLPRKLGFDEHCLWQHLRKPSRYANPGLEVNGEIKDFNDGQYGPDLVSDYALEFIARQKNRPFFLYYPMILPHAPYQPTPDSKSWPSGGRASPRAPSATGEGVSDRTHFGDMVEYADKLVGKLLARLDTLGIRENTLVIFLGDNGTGRGISSKVIGGKVEGGKGTTTIAGMRVPLIVNWPARIKGGQTHTDLIDSTDILPTLCAAAGIALPPDIALDGRSFLPQLLGEKGSPRQWVYSWYSPRQGADRSVREFAFNHRYKLYRNGRFYDLAKDESEERPIAAEELAGDALEARDALQRAVDQFKDARPPHIDEGLPASKQPRPRAGGRASPRAKSGLPAAK